MSIATWLDLFAHFLVLSFLSVGGVIATAPDMHRYLVSETGLIGDAQFNAAIAIAQSSPGPNVLFVAVLGWQAAGVAGVAATLLGIMIPSTSIAILVSRWGEARADWLPLRAFKLGMAPITIGLLAATGWILSADAPDWRLWVLTVAAALLVWRTHLPLLVLIGAGGVLGALGWV